MNFKNLKPHVKVQLGVIVAAVFAMQVGEVKNAVMPLLAGHPHIASIIGGVFSVVTLLQNPAVKKLLGVDQETK